MKSKEIYYIGGLDSNQRGAIGTHTAGIIHGYKENGYKVIGIFLEDKIPQVKCDEEILAPPSTGKFRKILVINSRLSLARKARNIDKGELIYHRFDPLLSPFVVTKNTILEYNDDMIEQIMFAAKSGQWTPIGRFIRRMLYPPIFRISEKYCFRRARAVVSVTEKLSMVVKNIEPRSHSIFAQNGSDAKFIPETADLNPPDNDVLRLAHVGTLTRWDGLIELLEAVSTFCNSNGSNLISLRIIGDGDLRLDIEETIDRLNLKNVVSLEDPVPHKEALNILHCVDVVPLLKTIYNCGLSPIKYYEALAIGCFLISSDIDHINEVKSDEGYVVPFPLVRDEIVTAIEYAFKNRKEIRQGRQDRSIRAQSEVTWKKRVSEIMSKVSRN